MLHKANIRSKRANTRMEDYRPEALSYIQAYQKGIAWQQDMINLLLSKESQIMEETFDSENQEPLAFRIQRIILSESKYSPESKRGKLKN
ncbi:MAG: hypothetical protein ACE5HC_14740 [Candidatus Binatia bacterium]